MDSRTTVKLNSRMQRIVDLITEREPLLTGGSPTTAVEHALVEWYKANTGDASDAIRHAMKHGLIRADDEIRVLRGPIASHGFRSGYWKIRIGDVEFEVYHSLNPRGYDSVAEMNQSVADSVREFMVKKANIRTDDGRYRYVSQSRYV